jgi:ferric-dicitrate binding protein FerR (iron transport regulator)
MAKNQELEKIERYIKGESDENEKRYIESLFINNGEENYILRNLIKEDWNNIFKDKIKEDCDLKELLDRIHHEIRKNESLNRNKPFKRFIGIYVKAAAILVLPLLIAGGLLFGYLLKKGKPIADRQAVTTIYAPMGSRVSFILPDSTSGMLNSGSHLSYSLPFSGNRHVELEGEAWFDVNKDEEHPFEINAGKSQVKVLGTTFNISAYPAENYIEVVLVEGKVEFNNEKDGEKVNMNPSERLVCQSDNITKLSVDPSKYYAWTEGKLVFRGDPMAEVARRIERWYNVKIIIADKELERYSFRGTFQDDSIEEVLRFLSLTSPIGYKVIPRTLMSDGTYRKEEITIFKLKI